MRKQFKIIAENGERKILAEFKAIISAEREYDRLKTMNPKEEIGLYWYKGKKLPKKLK